MSFNPTSFADQIPYYLSQEEKAGLVQELKNWPKPIKYYIKRYANEILQGDTWTKLPVRNLATGELKLIEGIIFSNSCQIDPTNVRSLPAKVTFAPLVDFDRYLSSLRSVGVSEQEITAKTTAIRSQLVHSIFYLPAGDGLRTERIALLDDVYSFPLNALDTSGNSNNKKLETLSMTGFYLFVFKLSIHFCRLHENVERRDAFA